MERIPKSGEFYRHFKNKLYQVITVATHSETGEQLVIYQALYGDYKTYARPLAMFVSEVDHEKYPDAEQKYRCERVEPGSWMKNTESVKAAPDTGSFKTGSLPNAAGDRREENVPVRDNVAQETKQPSTDPGCGSEKPEDQINPKVLEFLDTEDFEERYNILVSLRDELDDQMVNILAVALDVVIPEGRIDDRYEALKNCLRTRQRYESNRLR